MKNQLFKIFAITFIVTLLVFSLGGCGDSSSEASAETHTVVDHLDRTVSVPNNPQRVVCLHPIGTEIVYCLQAQDKLVAIDTYSSTLSMSQKIGVKTKDLTAFKTENYNVEAIAALNPDLVIGTAYYPDDIQKLQDAGLTAIAFDFHGRTTNEEIELLGDALGKDEEADELISFRTEIAEKVAAIVETIPQEERKDVFYIRYSNTALLTASVNTFEHELISDAGGINLGKDITQGKWVEVSWEQILLWNPDVVMSAPLITTGTFLTVDDLKADEKWSKIQAVADNNVWVMPIGYFKMDCSAPENCLGLEYLAKRMYPEQFAGLDLEKDIKDFFKTFYHYDLSAEELVTILQPEGIQMGNN